jgi:hypothetical protein
LSFLQLKITREEITKKEATNNRCFIDDVLPGRVQNRAMTGSSERKCSNQGDLRWSYTYEMSGKIKTGKY